MADTYVIVIPSLTFGGAEKEAFHYAKIIRDAQLGEPVVVGLGRDGELRPKLEAEGIRCLTFNASDFFQSNRVLKLKSVLRWWYFLVKLRPTYLLGMTHWPNLLCGIVWRFCAAKRFIWFQFSVDSSIGITVWEKIAKWGRPCYVSNGIAGAQFIAQRHVVSQNSVSIIPNPLNAPESVNPSGEEEDIHIVMTANFFPEKDHITLLRAMRIYLDMPDARNWKLHFLGGSPGKGGLQHEAKAHAFDLGLCGRVMFHGKVENVPDVLQSCGLGILSTRSEGMSNAVLEYMAYGLPVIATDIIANREALGEENGEWLFPVGDEVALADMLYRMLHKANRSAIGMRNRQRVTERHSPQMFRRQVIDLLKLEHC